MNKKTSQQLHQHRKHLSPDRAVLLGAFLVPFVCMLLSFIAAGIYPFGQRSFLFSDMYHQYMPFFSEFVHKVKAGESLSYSWNVGIGSNFLALYVYYLASPFNWLAFLFPEEHLMEFMSYLVVFRIGLCGLTTAFYLQKKFPPQGKRALAFGGTDPMVLFFSTCYAFSGYVAAYNWNIMWLDCLILLPLILYALERLVRTGRWGWYTVCLALSIWTNYYISIMICIFVVLYFIALLVMRGHRRCTEQRPVMAEQEPEDSTDQMLKEVAQKQMQSPTASAAAMKHSRKATSTAAGMHRGLGWTILHFTIGSLLAGGLAAALLVPEVCAILQTNFGESTFPTELKSYFSILEELSRHCMNVTTERGLEHWPNIYCGAAVFLLIPLYVVNERIPIRERFCKLMLAGFLLLSFSMNVLDFLWHGLNYPDSLPARQSFLYIFLVVVMCYEAYRYVDGIAPKQILYSYLAAVFFLLGCEYFIDSDDFGTGVEIFNIVLVTIYAVLLYLYRTRERAAVWQVLFVMALGIVCTELCLNMGNTSLGTVSRSAYLKSQEDYQVLAAEVKELEGDNFYRIEKFTRKTKNDGTLTGYPTASVFSSTLNSSVMELFDRLGMHHSKVFYGYDGATPFTSALLNVDYLFGEEEKYAGALYDLIDQSGDIYLYEAKYTLPFGYVAPEGWDLPEETDNSALLQNQLVEELGISGKLLHKVDTETVGDDVRMSAEEPGTYYARISASGTKKVRIIGGSLETEEYKDLKADTLVYLGYLGAGDSVTIQNSDEDDDTNEIAADAYLLDTEVCKEAIEVLSENHLENVSYDSTHISGTVSMPEAGRLILSVGYENGWTVTVNGEEVEPALFGESFIALDLEAGEYEISLSYVPQGKWAGIAVSVGSVLAFAIAMLLGGKARNRHARDAGAQSQDA